MLQRLSSFMTCVEDLSWIFRESLQLIQTFIHETSEYYSTRKSKRIRLDNIEKEYLTLKLRFEAMDLEQIQIFLYDLDKQSKSHRLHGDFDTKLLNFSSHTIQREGEEKMKRGR